MVKEKVPHQLSELASLGRTLKRRSGDMLAYFDRESTSYGPTAAINGRLEHPRGSALGLKNRANYIARPLLDADGFRPGVHPSPIVKSHQTAIAPLVECTSRFVMLVRLPGDHPAEAVRDGLIKAMRTLPLQLRSSLIWDRDAGMDRHKTISLATDMEV